MTQAAAFSTAHKNALLDCLTGKAAALMTANVGNFSEVQSEIKIYSSLYGNVSGQLCSNGMNPGNVSHWGSAIAGTAPFAMSFYPDAAGGAAVWARWFLYSSGLGLNILVDGLVTTTGGGGMIIVPSTTVTQFSNVQIHATFKMPLNNGGTLNINGTLANNLLSTLIYDVNQPKIGTSGVLSIYGGTQPANADTPITNQTLLCNSYTLSGTTFASALGGSARIAANITAASNAVGSGTATWFRWVKGGNVMDGSCGTAGAGLDMILATTTFTSGVAAPDVTSMILTFP